MIFATNGLCRNAHFTCPIDITSHFTIRLHETRVSDVAPFREWHRRRRFQPIIGLCDSFPYDSYLFHPCLLFTRSLSWNIFFIEIAAASDSEITSRCYVRAHRYFVQDRATESDKRNSDWRSRQRRQLWRLQTETIADALISAPEARLVVPTSMRISTSTMLYHVFSFPPSNLLSFATYIYRVVLFA